MQNTKERAEAKEKMVEIHENEIKSHLDGIVRGTVEETLNAMLDAEADVICGAGRYEPSEDRVDTRAGHYKRSLHTKAGKVELKVPKLRNLPFESECAPGGGDRRGALGRARQPRDNQ